MNSASESEDLELRHYLEVLRRRKLSLVLTVVAVVAAGLLFTLLQTPVYRSTAEILVQPRLSEQIFSPTADLDSRQPAPASDVETQVAVLESEPVRQAAEDAFGHPVDVKIARKGETAVVQVTATSTDRDEAARIAQTYTDKFLSMRREQLTTELRATTDAVGSEIAALDTQLVGLDQQIRDLNTRIQATFIREVRAPLEAQRDQLAQQRLGPESRRSDLQQRLDRLELAATVNKTGGVELLSGASEPSQPSSRTLQRNLALALALGIIFGVVVAFLRDHFDRTVRGEDDLERESGRTPLLSPIPRVPTWDDRDTAVLVSRSAPQSPAGEAYGRLRASIELAGISQSKRAVQVTSAGPGDGKTTTLANLGVSFARAGRRVVLVDGNLRRPRLHRFFGFDNEVGLTSVLLGETTLATAMQLSAEEDQLVVLPSGPLPADPAGLLSTEGFRELLSSLASEADVVLVDSPPLPVTDAIVLAGRVGAVVLVTCANRTDRRDLAEALEVLERMNAPLVGTILNCTRGKASHGLTYGREPTSRRRRRRSFLRRRAQTEPAPSTSSPEAAAKPEAARPPKAAAEPEAARPKAAAEPEAAAEPVLETPMSVDS